MIFCVGLLLAVIFLGLAEIAEQNEKERKKHGEKDELLEAYRSYLQKKKAIRQAKQQKEMQALIDDISGLAHDIQILEAEIVQNSPTK